MLIFYGAPKSSATRTHWLLEELGIPYEYRRVDFANKSPDFLAASPGGKVPAIVDDDVKLFESIAVDFYLAEKYGSYMAGKTLGEKAQTLQWSAWALTNVNPLVIQVLYHTKYLPEAERRADVAKDNREWAAHYLSILDAHLKAHSFLVGDRFSIADIDVASVVNLALAVGVEAGTETRDWMRKLKSRPAYQRATAAD